MNANEFLSLTQDLSSILLPLKKYWQIEAMEISGQELGQWGDESLRAFLCDNQEGQKKWETTHDLALLPSGAEKDKILHLHQLLPYTYQNSANEVAEIQKCFNPLRIKEKKLLELSEIMAKLKSLDPFFFQKKFWEIGGGKGHLAYALATLTQSEVASIDRNPELQNLGKERIRRYLPKDGPAQVRFICQNLAPDLGELPMQLRPQHFLLGLHTCGPLALYMAELFKQGQSQGMLNIPCCYYHLNHVNEVNLSHHFQKNPFPWNQEALTLATHAHTPMDIKDYEFKNRVKMFRFSLHNLLKEERGITNRLALGTSPRRLYEKSFSEYALSNFSKIKFSHNFSAKQLDDFYHHPSNQLNVKERIGFQAYRNIWGRGLEYILILDRALNLRDLGYDVSIKAFFPVNQSPRNIGILATKSPQ